MDRPRQPALDGIRGVAVAMVLAFHGGFGWMSGGYVGVSVFFTLSGFLITRLLLDEHEGTGRIGLSRFWNRRIRRLLPASLMCIVGVVLLWKAGAFAATIDLRADVLGAVGQVFNWVQLAGDTSYTEQVAGGLSPLDHFWSLAIEEQFYWLWPVVLIAILRTARPDRWIVAITAVSCAAAPLIAVVWGADAAYWATPARAGEILVGASLAVMVRRRPGFAGVHGDWLGAAGATVVVLCAVTWTADGGPAYSGWFPVFALASGAVILGALAGPVLSAGLAFSPLVGLGRISYGVYLFHWPIFLLVDERLDRTTGSFAIKVALTLVVAMASFQFVERPVQVARPDFGRDAVLAVGSMTAVAIAALVVPLTADDPFADPELAAGQLDDVVTDTSPLIPLTSVATDAPDARNRDRAPTAADTTAAAETAAAETTEPAPSIATETTPPPAASTTTTSEVVARDDGPPADVEALPPVPPRPVRVLIAGDSVAWTVANGLVAWADEHPEYLAFDQEIAISCGFIEPTETPILDGEYQEDCDDMVDRRLPAAIERVKPDVVMLMTTRADVEPRTWSSDEGQLDATDERFVDRQVADYVELTREIHEAGTPHVIWLTPPVVRSGPLPDAPMMDPTAMASLWSAFDETAEVSGDNTHTIDLARWYPAAGFDDRDARPDGIHFQLDPSTEIADRFMAGSILQIALGR